MKIQLQTISKLDLGVKWLNVSFQLTTNEKSWTTNNYKRFQSSISKVNGLSFVLEELQTIKAQLQTISKLELEENRVLVRFRGTTNDKNTTTNDFKARSWGKITQPEFLANYKRKKINYKQLQTIKAQLQTISKLELEEKWVLVRLRGTTNDKNKTTNDFEAWARRKMGPRSFSRNYKR